MSIFSVQFAFNNDASSVLHKQHKCLEKSFCDEELAAARISSLSVFGVDCERNQTPQKHQYLKARASLERRIVSVRFRNSSLRHSHALENAFFKY